MLSFREPGPPNHAQRGYAANSREQEGLTIESIVMTSGRQVIAAGNTVFPPA
jgi:hypothetical protein